tara:strand:- start:1488 stop:1670 length:183 start_codon:yes stop_codon:yes gene_type:complete
MNLASDIADNPAKGLLAMSEEIQRTVTIELITNSPVTTARDPPKIKNTSQYPTASLSGVP